MAGIPPERQAIGRRFYLFILTVGLLLLPRISFGQAVAVGGSQSSARSVSFQILDQRRVYFGQHSITFNRVAQPVFPVPVSTPTPAPAVPAQLFANCELLFLGATVFDGQYSIVQRIDGDQGFVAVSNIDFDYFGIEGFVGGDTFYELIMALDNESSTDADPVTAGWLAQARGSLPAGSAPGYVIVSGTASADDIQALNALHAFFGANASTLEQEYQQRQAQYAAELLQSKLHPPVRPNTVINYWPIKSDVSAPAIAVLDLSGSNTGGVSVNTVSIDDSNNAAFGYYGEDGTDYDVYTWVGGEPEQSQILPLTSGNINGFDSYDPDDDSLEVESVSYTPTVLTPSGQLYGDANVYVKNIPSPEQSFTAFGGFLSNSSGVNYLNSSVSLGATENAYMGTPVSPFWGDNVFLGGQDVYAIVSETNAVSFVYQGSFYNSNGNSITPPNVQPAYFEPTEMNTSGWAFGSDINNDTESWNGNSIVSLPGALHLNNQDFVIGNGSSGGCRWQSGTSVSIASLLPPSYQNQINGIAPCFLSNQNQNDGTTNIYFNA